MTTPLPVVDRRQVEGFWDRCIASGAVPPGTALPKAVEPFGDSAELADELLDLVLHVPKLASVDDAFAWDEGEGDRTRADWLATHTAFFQRLLAELGDDFDERMPVVFQRFEVVFSE